MIEYVSVFFFFRLTASGILQHLNRIPLKFDPKANPNVAVTETTQPIRVEHIAAGLSFWAVGMTVGMLAFAGELARQKTHRRRNQTMEEAGSMYART